METTRINLTYWERFADEMLRITAISLADDNETTSESVHRLPGFRKDGLRRSLRGATHRAIKDVGHAAEKSQIGAWGRLFSSDPGFLSRSVPLLALLAAAETSTQRRQLIRRLGGTADGCWTLGALHEVLPHAAEELSPTGVLCASGFVLASGDSSWAKRAVWIAPPLMWQLFGALEVNDPSLPTDLDQLDTHETRPRETRVVLVSGIDAFSRQERATNLLGGDGSIVVSFREPLQQDEERNERKPFGPTENEWLAILREATLTRRSIVIDLGGSMPSFVKSSLYRCSHIGWGITSAHRLSVSDLPNRPWIEDSVDQNTAGVTKGSQNELLHQLGDYRLTPTQLHQVGKATSEASDGLITATQRLISGEIDRLALRITPTRSWKDLVLPEKEYRAVRQVADRYRHRRTVLDDWAFNEHLGNGIVALFSGPPGTGKSLAAEVIAKDLGIDLFRVNTASLVSKFIGETEKNLERLFDAAETGAIALLFDEADSIFGKRGDVSKSSDRYANLEISYLLQRIESFGGLIFLTSNLLGNIDSAFTRRIHVSIAFEKPETEERLRLWEIAIPAAAPTTKIDHDFLSSLALTGAEIKNIASNAAFMAAAEKSAISMKHLVTALDEETTKKGRLTDNRSLGKYAAHLNPKEK